MNAGRQPAASHGGGFAAADLPERRAGYGAAPPASRLLRIAAATALRAGPDPGDHCGPSGRKRGQAQACPSQERGAPGGHARAGARSLSVRDRKVKITTSEVSTIPGESRRAYYDRKLAEGKTPKEALRCLKRRVSDAIYAAPAGRRPPGRRIRQDKGPGRATGERLCRQRGRLTPRKPALRPSHSRARHHPTTPGRTLTHTSSPSSEEKPERLLTQRGFVMRADLGGPRWSAARRKNGCYGVRGHRLPIWHGWVNARAWARSTVVARPVPGRHLGRWAAAYQYRMTWPTGCYGGDGRGGRAACRATAPIWPVVAMPGGNPCPWGRTIRWPPTSARRAVPWRRRRPRARGAVSSQVSLPTRTAQRRGRSYDRPLRWACFSGSLRAGYPLVMVKCSTPQAEVAPALLPSPL